MDRSYRPRRPAAWAGFTSLLGSTLLASCSYADINSSSPRVPVCHKAGVISSMIEIPQAAVTAHLEHGDYVTLLEVDPLTTTTDSTHFRRVTDALAVARAGRLARGELETGACRITIAVAPTVLPGSTSASPNPLFELFPLVIDVPDITLLGALRMQVDASGKATGVGEGGLMTTFAPAPALILKGTSSQTAVSERTIIINSHPTGSKGDGAIIEGFVFQSGRAAGDTTAGGQGIGTFRARNLILRGNRFDGGFNSAMDLQASSALVERNHLSGIGSSCDVCLAGPGDYIVRHNRILGGGIPGVLILPTGLFPNPAEVEPYTLPATATVTAIVENNEVRDHKKKPVGVGLRIGAIGVGAATVEGTSKATFTGNTLVGNTLGIIVEAAFVNATGRRGDIELTTSGNVISQSCQNDVLVSMTNSQTALGIGTGLSLLNSSFKLNLGADIPWDRAWYHNPTAAGNTLVVNGGTIANGSRVAYDATKVCP
jgi:hypothetical protein